MAVGSLVGCPIHTVLNIQTPELQWRSALEVHSHRANIVTLRKVILCIIWVKPRNQRQAACGCPARGKFKPEAIIDLATVRAGTDGNIAAGVAGVERRRERCQ